MTHHEPELAVWWTIGVVGRVVEDVTKLNMQGIYYGTSTLRYIGVHTL